MSSRTSCASCLTTGSPSKIDQLSPRVDRRGERTESRVIGFRCGVIGSGSPHQIGQNSDMRTIELKLEPFLQSRRYMLITFDNRDPSFITQMHTGRATRGLRWSTHSRTPRFCRFRAHTIIEMIVFFPPATGNNNPRLLFSSAER